MYIHSLYDMYRLRLDRVRCIS